MKKLLTLTLLTIGLSGQAFSAVAGAIPKRGSADPVAAVKPKPQLADETLLGLMQNIKDALANASDLDSKIKEFQLFADELSNLDAKELSREGKTAVYKALNEVIKKIDTEIRKREEWLSDDYQVKTLKEIRLQLSELINKFCGYSYGLPSTMYSVWKKHWRKVGYATVFAAGYALAIYKSQTPTPFPAALDFRKDPAMQAAMMAKVLAK